MSRRNTRAAPLVDLGADLSRVVIDIRADPDAPNRDIRGARARCHYDVLHARGGLKDPEREAADRYAVLCEMEAGARDRPEVRCGRTPPWMQGHPILTQIQAVAGLRSVHDAVGRDATALLRMYVRDNQPAKMIAGKRSETEAAVVGRIKGALLRAAEHWGMDR